MNVVILGCGRVGATLAMKLDRAGHLVTIIDASNESFQRLEQGFRGQQVVGNGVDEEILRRAGIEHADAFVAVTNGDNRNIMASQIARETFHVKKVVCRIYDPRRHSTYEKLGLESFCPTLVGADLLFAAINEQKTNRATEDMKR